MKGIRICATGRYLPSRVVSNEDFSNIVETSDEWIVKRTGMKERRVSSGEATWAMGAFAAKDALDSGKIDPLSIDLLLFTTVTGDYATPSMACLVQAKIGASNAMCMDINAACSGFVYALDMARRYLCCEDIRRVLIVSSEALSRITDYTDRSTCVLFGDGAGAVVVDAADTLYASDLMADGSKASLLYCKSRFALENPFVDPALVPPYEESICPQTDKLFMDGREVYKFAVRAFPKVVEGACKKAGIALQELCLIVPHQANLRIVEAAAKTMDFPLEKMYVNLEKYGNTSSACGPICLDEINKENRLERGSLVAVAGFGAGVTAAAAVFVW